MQTHAFGFVLSASALLMASFAALPTAGAVCAAQAGSTSVGCVTMGGGCLASVIPVDSGSSPDLGVGAVCGDSYGNFCAVTLLGTTFEPSGFACVDTSPSNGCLAGIGATRDLMVHVVC